ncbi:hypothetical protein ACS0TY_013245 [Phlomoides rotata]
MESDKGKGSRGRRSWTRIEEKAFIQCLTIIVNEGWKADNGFKAGFQRELEKGMRKILSGTDICATPHINSKIHVWKKEYGEHVVDPIDIVNEMLHCTVEQEGETRVKYDVINTGDNEVDENMSVAQPSQTGLKNSAKGKKRKIMDQSMSAFVETIGEYMKGSDETFNTLAQHMGSEYDVKIERTTLNDIMKLIPWLSMRDKLKVSNEVGDLAHLATGFLT